MGHGGYSTCDFLIFGTPMQIVLLFVSIVALVVPDWWLVCLTSFGVLALVCLLRVLQDAKNVGRIQTWKSLSIRMTLHE